MEKISIYIICKNEAKKIDKTLSQASKLAQEIILVDSGSTDETLLIAEKYSCKIIFQEWLGYSCQKEFALAKCNNEWVLNLDADEVLTDELIEEIQALDFSCDAYRIARKLFIGHKFIRWGAYYPDRQLRLFRKSLGHYPTKAVHESVSLEGRIENLSKPLEHYAYADLDEMQQAFVKYAKLANKQSDFWRALFSMIFTFVYRYFFRLGFLEARFGFQMAIIHSKYSFDKYFSI